MLNFTTPSAASISNEARIAMKKFFSCVLKSCKSDTPNICLAKVIKLLLQSEMEFVTTSFRPGEDDIQKDIREDFERQNFNLTSQEDTQLLNILIQNLEYSEILSILNCWKPIIKECLYVCGYDCFLKRPQYLTQPRELADFAINLLNPEEGKIIYNPFFGMGSYAMSAPNNIFVGEEYDIETLKLAWLRMGAAGISYEVKHGDSFIESNDLAQSYNYIVFTPPFGIGPRGRSEADAIMLALNRLKDNGTMVVVVPAKFASDAFGVWADLKRELVNNHLLKAVISLPPLNPSLSSIEECVILIKKEEGDSFVAVDGTKYGEISISELFSKLKDDMDSISGPNIRKVHYNELGNHDLRPSKLTYKLVAPEGTTLMRLGDLIEFSPRESIGGPYIDVISRCSFDYLNCVQEKFLFEDEGTPLRRNRRVYQDSILINPCEGGLRVGRMPELDLEKEYFITVPATMVGRIKESAKDLILFDYLLKVLSSDFMVQQVQNAMYGVVSYSIKDEDYPNLKIPVPSIEQQRKDLNADLKESVKEAHEELKANLENYKKEIHMRKHALSQTFSGLDARWKRLVGYAKRNGGIIKLDDVIGIANQVSVQEIFDVISQRFATVANQIAHLADDNHDWGEAEDIDPQKFLEDFKRDNISPDFRIRINGNGNKTETEPVINDDGSTSYLDIEATTNFRAPKEAVKQVLANILANARDHGFIDPNRFDYEVTFDWGKTTDGKVWLTVANNGAPLPKDVNPEDVLTYGFSTKLNEGSHTGLGGSDSKAIMSRFGSLSVISEPDSEYPVTYKLIFNETNKSII